MTTDLSALDRFKEGEPEGGPAPLVPMVAPITPKLWQFTLAVDQSVRDTGWAWMFGSTVHETGNIRVQTFENKKGQEDLLQKADLIFEKFLEMLDDMKPALVAHELPPAGGRLRSPESSLAAAVALRNAAWVKKIPVVMYQSQKVKKRVTGNGRATKAEVREAVLHLDPKIRDLKPRNEAIYDAIAVGWVACEEGER